MICCLHAFTECSIHFNDGLRALVIINDKRRRLCNNVKAIVPAYVSTNLVNLEQLVKVIDFLFNRLKTSCECLMND